MNRMMARKEGRIYCDGVTLTYQTERMPEPIRLKMGGVLPHQVKSREILYLYFYVYAYLQYCGSQ
jgi:hypothetical protein